jgi:hypothetical protein
MAETLEALSAIVADLSSRVNQLSNRQVVSEVPSNTKESTPPNEVWYCTYATGLTLTEGIGDDWDVRFDDRSVATNRLSFFHPAPGGSLNHLWEGADSQHRFKLTWDSPQAETVRATISADGYMQLKLNGEIVELFFDAAVDGGIGHYDLSLETKAGRNELVICKGLYPPSVIFHATMFGGEGASVVDVTKLEGYTH